MLTPIQECRVQVGDMDVNFPILDDSTYDYFLSKNNNSVRRASLEAARTILFQLSMRTDETVDIFSVKGGKAAEQYRLALALFLKDPSLNPVFTSAKIYAGGISNSDINTNNNMFDNNSVDAQFDRVKLVNTSDPFAYTGL